MISIIFLYFIVITSKGIINFVNYIIIIIVKIYLLNKKISIDIKLFLSKKNYF